MRYKVTLIRYSAEYFETEVSADNQQGATDKALENYFDGEYDNTLWEPALWVDDLPTEAHAELIKEQGA